MDHALVDVTERSLPLIYVSRGGPAAAVVEGAAWSGPCLFRRIRQGSSSQRLTTTLGPPNLVKTELTALSIVRGVLSCARPCAIRRPDPRGMSVECRNLRPDEPLVGEIVTVEPLDESHREDLRAAADEDPDHLSLHGLSGRLRRLVRRGARGARRRSVRHGRRRPGGGLEPVPELRAAPPPRRDRLDVARAVVLGHGRKHRDEAAPDGARLRTTWNAAGRVQDRRAQRADAGGAPEGRRPVRRHRPQAHDAADGAARFGLVRGDRGRLARGEGTAPRRLQISE